MYCMRTSHDASPAKYYIDTDEIKKECRGTLHCHRIIYTWRPTFMRRTTAWQARHLLYGMVDMRQCRRRSVLGKTQWWALIRKLQLNKLYTVDSHYLEIQGTLWNTSRYPYFDISDLRNWGKQLIKQPLLTKWIFNLTVKLEMYWKYCGKEEKLLLRSNFSSFPQYLVACW